MKRRDFLTSALATGAVYGTGGLPGIVASANAQNAFAPVNNRLLVNVNLRGGPDWRHVMPPAYSTAAGSFGSKFWEARARSFGIADSASARNAKWSDDYYHRSANGQEFGILKSCEWLKDMWDSGNVAVVNNVLGSPTRDHHHAELVLMQGNRESGVNDFGRSGWGGRLASFAGANVLGLTSAPNEFCHGLHPSGDINEYYVGNLIGARDTRDMSLYSASTDTSNAPWDARGNVTRALRAYYQALRNEISAESPYARFVDHEAAMRQFGDLIDERLAGLPEPQEMKDLHDWSGTNRLANASFGLQTRNLYDVIACNDILNMRVASMEYGGWDSHDSQAEQIEPRLHDLFGAGRAFDVLWQNLPADARDNTVFVIAGEFGRQLVANGGNGTDHGRGTSYLVIGGRVNGGIYGDQFPVSELSKMHDVSPDIDGLTEFDHVLGTICDWVEPGSSSTVFPSRGNAMIETGLGLSGLFV